MACGDRKLPIVARNRTVGFLGTVQRKRGVTWPVVLVPHVPLVIGTGTTPFCTGALKVLRFKISIGWKIVCRFTYNNNAK